MCLQSAPSQLYVCPQFVQYQQPPTSGVSSAAEESLLSADDHERARRRRKPSQTQRLTSAMDMTSHPEVASGGLSTPGPGTLVAGALPAGALPYLAAAGFGVSEQVHCQVSCAAGAFCILGTL